MSHHTDVGRSHGKYMFLSLVETVLVTQKIRQSQGENVIKFGTVYVVYILLVFKKLPFFKNSRKPD